MHQFYPTVGMRTPAEMIEANFGRDQFAFDIESFIKASPTLMQVDLILIFLTLSFSFSCCG